MSPQQISTTILSQGHLAWGSVEWARSARLTASTGPIVTVRITLISDPDTRIDGALMAQQYLTVRYRINGIIPWLPISFT